MNRFQRYREEFLDSSEPNFGHEQRFMDLLGNEEKKHFSWKYLVAAIVILSGAILFLMNTNTTALVKEELVVEDTKDLIKENQIKDQVKIPKLIENNKQPEVVFENKKKLEIKVNKKPINKNHPIEVVVENELPKIDLETSNTFIVDNISFSKDTLTTDLTENKKIKKAPKEDFPEDVYMLLAASEHLDSDNIIKNKNQLKTSDKEYVTLAEKIKNITTSKLKKDKDRDILVDGDYE